MGHWCGAAWGQGTPWYVPLYCCMNAALFGSMPCFVVVASTTHHSLEQTEQRRLPQPRGRAYGALQMPCSTLVPNSMPPPTRPAATVCDKRQPHDAQQMECVAATRSWLPSGQRGLFWQVLKGDNSSVWPGPPCEGLVDTLGQTNRPPPMCSKGLLTHSIAAPPTHADSTPRLPHNPKTCWCRQMATAEQQGSKYSTESKAVGRGRRS